VIEFRNRDGNTVKGWWNRLRLGYIVWCCLLRRGADRVVTLSGLEPNQTLHVSRQRHSHSTDHAYTLHLPLPVTLHSFISLIEFIYLSIYILTHSLAFTHQPKLPPLLDSLPLTRRYSLYSIIFWRFIDSQFRSITPTLSSPNLDLMLPTSAIIFFIYQ